MIHNPSDVFQRLPRRSLFRRRLRVLVRPHEVIQQLGQTRHPLNVRQLELLKEIRILRRRRLQCAFTFSF